MDLLPEWLPIALALAVLGGLLAVWLVMRRRQRQDAPSTRPRSLEGLDTLASWTPERSRILTGRERQAYNLLKAALPDHMVLAQVPLARFLRVPTRNSYSEWMRRVGQLCADLVVCNGNSEVMAVIEIRQPQGQESERGLKRHERMDRVLSAAGITLHVWREDMLPTVHSVRVAILGAAAVAAGAAEVAAEPARQSSVVSQLGPLQTVGTARSIHDLDLPEATELPPHREPPPSTWFEDLDSAPTPLHEEKVN